MMTEYLFLNDGNNLMLEGDFGYLSYENKTYFSSHILFYSPSLHTFSNNRMPFEMQIIHKDDKGNQISVSILYKYSKSDYSLFLAQLGFDKEQLRNQQAFLPTTIKEDINLSKYVNDEKDFFVYESKIFLPLCDKKSVNFILTDVLKISEMQIKNFPEIVLNKNKEVQQRNERKIYTTFRMEDIEAKMKEQALKLAVIKKQKEEFEKLENLAVKQITEKVKLENNCNFFLAKIKKNFFILFF
jgi:carbonic anhydrase